MSDLSREGTEECAHAFTKPTTHTTVGETISQTGSRYGIIVK